MMKQTGFFNVEARCVALSTVRDPLERLVGVIAFLERAALASRWCEGYLWACGGEPLRVDSRIFCTF